MRKNILTAALAAFFMLAFFAPVLHAAELYAGEEIISVGELAEPEDFPLEYENTEAPPIIPTDAYGAAELPSVPPGTGTVIDVESDPSNGRRFYTIMTADEHVFYLIIDMQRDTENVYFLNAVTLADLAALAEQGGGTWESVSAPPPIIPNAPPELEYETEAENEPESEATPEQRQGGNAGLVVLLVFIIIGGVGAGWYFKIYRPKQLDMVDDDDYDYDILSDKPENAYSEWDNDESEDSE